MVQAVVQVREGVATGPELEREIIGWLRERIDHYKCPRSMAFVERLPRSAAGKMMKYRLGAAARPVPFRHSGQPAEDLETTSLLADGIANRVSAHELKELS